MANNAYTQQALSLQPSFHLRLQNALTKVAFQVMSEPTDTPYYTQRVSYAQRVINQPSQTAVSLASSFVNRPNLLAFETSYNFEMREVVTASGDADIESQIYTDWNMLAGVLIVPPTNPGGLV
jgi:hypothetical protein